MANERQPPDSTGFRAENEIDEVLGYANRNPERVGCPARDVLVAASKREIPADHLVHRHLITCSPCYREVRGLQQAAGEHRFISAPRNWWPAAAPAGVIIDVVGWLVAGRLDVSPTGDPPAESQVLSVQLDLREHVMMRGDQQTDAPPLTLPRGHLDLNLVLPSRSEPGGYDVQILDSSLASRASTMGAAEMREFMTVLSAHHSAFTVRSAAAGPAMSLALG